MKFALIVSIFLVVACQRKYTMHTDQISVDLKVVGGIRYFKKTVAGSSVFMCFEENIIIDCKFYDALVDERGK